MALRSQERRSAPRIVAKLAMQVAGGDDDEAVLTTESINLSASGIQFLSRAFLSPLTKVQLTLLLPPFGSRLRRERMVQCEAIVVRCEEADGARSRPRYELACYFSDVESDDRVLIEQYVGWRSLRRLPAATPAVSAAPARKPARTAVKASRKAGAKKAAKPAAKKRPAARRTATAAKKKRRSSSS